MGLALRSPIALAVDAEAPSAHPPDKATTDIIGLLILLVIPFSFAAAATVLKHKRKMAREETLRLALAQGPNLSPELLAFLQEGARAPGQDGQGALPNAAFAASLLIGSGLLLWIKESLGMLFFFVCMGIGVVLRAALAPPSRK
jgi:hypothetical protein